MVDAVKTGSSVEGVIDELVTLSIDFYIHDLAKDLHKVINEMNRLISENWNPKIELENAVERIKPILEDVLGMTMRAKLSLKLLPYDEKSGNLGSHPIGTNEIIIYLTNINGVISLHIRKGVLAHELYHAIMNGVKGA